MNRHMYNVTDSFESKRGMILRKRQSMETIINFNRPKEHDKPKSGTPLPVKAKLKKSKSVLIDSRKHQKTSTKRKVKSYTDLLKKVKDDHKSRHSAKSSKPSATVPKQFTVRRPATERVEPINAVRKCFDWDYKTRFALLSEKYATLQQTHKDAKEKLLVLDHTEQQLTWLQDNFNEKDKKINELTLENKRQKNQIAELEEIYGQHKELKNSYNTLLDNYGTCLKIIDDLKNELNNLRQAKFELTKKCSGLEQENNGLKSDILKYEKTRKDLHNTVQELKGNIRVYCRIRPAVNAVELKKTSCCISYIDEQTIEIKRCRPSNGKYCEIKADFQFDQVFSPQATQSQVFAEMAQLVQSALDGYNVCIFAYGQTGSGKTYTMLGGNTLEAMGMVPRTIDLIFTSIRNLERLGWVYTIQAAFLEIYNETIIDLLEPENREPKEIRFNDGKGLVVTNVTVKTIQTAQELKDYVILAQKKRAMAVSDFNEHSARSHSIVRIELKGVHREIRSIYAGSINLVDLAGSETLNKRSSNHRICETKSINRSLANLGNVMLALHRKEAHVPYRNSKLTHLLQCSLGGSSKTLMIVNITPFDECYCESLNSLRFAAAIKETKTCSRKTASVY